MYHKRTFPSVKPTTHASMFSFKFFFYSLCIPSRLTFFFRRSCSLEGCSFLSWCLQDGSLQSASKINQKLFSIHSADPTSSLRLHPLLKLSNHFDEIFKPNDATELKLIRLLIIKNMSWLGSSLLPLGSLLCSLWLPSFSLKSLQICSLNDFFVLIWNKLCFYKTDTIFSCACALAALKNTMLRIFFTPSF